MAGDLLFPAAVAGYIAAHTQQSDIQRRLREETIPLPDSRMLLSADEAALLGLLVRLSGGRRVLEVGTFTGYSALAMALALQPTGRLVACDLSAEWTAIGQRYWREAGVADQIDLRLGPGSDTLAALLAAGEAGTFDFAFIDADKQGYDGYYEAGLKLLRPGGAIAFDNMIWSGRVADPAVQDADTVALRALNDKVTADPRVESVLLSVGDGLLVAWKKPVEEAVSG